MFGLVVAVLRMVGLVEAGDGMRCERCDVDFAGGVALEQRETPFGLVEYVEAVCFDCAMSIGAEFDSASDLVWVDTHSFV